MTTKLKYKVCKGCGNRNHPLSQQCAWCGSRLPGSMSWFAILCIVLIILVLGGLAAYTWCCRSPHPATPRLLFNRAAPEAPAAPAPSPAAP